MPITLEDISGTSIVSSKFQVGDLVTDAENYGRVASPEEYTKTPGKQIKWPPFFGNQVIFFTGTHYIIASESLVRKVESPRAEIVLLEEQKDARLAELRRTSAETVEATIRRYRTEMLERLYTTTRQALEEQANLALQKASRRFEEQTTRNIQYLRTA